LAAHTCRIQVPQRGNKLAWLNFARQNLNQALESKQKSWASLQDAYQALAKRLNISKIERMEGFDISHTQGELTVASCVVFNAQGPSKKDYRRFNIEGIQAGDDYAAMQQVLERRAKVYAQNPQLKPDLVVIDGGLGQVRVAKTVLGQDYVILGVSKGPLRKAGMEKLILAHGETVFSLAADDPALHLLQHLRDEAHRFAITWHRKKRQKRVLDSSLSSIPGIGPQRRRQLLQFFGGIQDLARASVEEIAKVPGIHLALAKKIFAHFHS
jgi:excinuclease ABC subunit C